MCVHQPILKLVVVAHFMYIWPSMLTVVFFWIVLQLIIYAVCEYVCWSSKQFLVEFTFSIGCVSITRSREI